MTGGLIVGHRHIGESIVEALEALTGGIEHLHHLSNDTYSTRELAAAISDVGRSYADDGLMIFVDVYGGSCWRASMIAQCPWKHVITGINLPMLLSFLHKRDDLAFDELADILEHDGKRAIRAT